MSARDLPSPLLAVTDRHGHPRPLVETVRAVLDGGCRWIWLRDRDLPTDDRRRLAEAVLAVVRAAGGTFTIGGDTDLALSAGADGVHLGGKTCPEAVVSAREKLGARAWIGVSAHSLPDVRAAAEAGADYVTLSPIFATASKPGYGPALGLSALRETARAGIPIVALGGITPETASACREAGAAGVAIMGGSMRASEPVGETRRYLAALERPRGDVGSGSV